MGLVLSLKSQLQISLRGIKIPLRSTKRGQLSQISEHAVEYYRLTREHGFYIA